MPNHVTTTLTIIGPADDIQRLRDAHITVQREGDADEAYLDFQSLIPMPDVLVGITSSSGMSLAVQFLLRGEPAPYDLSALQRLTAARLYPKLPDDEMARRFQSLSDDDLAQGRRALQAIAETGSPSWYEWNTAHWGTKWNSYHFSVVTDASNRFVCRFDTAWSTPTPIFEELARRFPTLTFHTHSYDEGGMFEAHGFGRNGEFSERTADCTAEGHFLAYGDWPEYEEEEEEVGRG